MTAKLSTELLRDFEQFSESLRNFSKWWPEGMGKVSPTDIDCVLHCSIPGGKDRCLVLEFKRQGAKVGIGQQITFDYFRRIGMEVVVVHENRDGTLLLSGDWRATVSTEVFSQMVFDWWKRAKEEGKKANDSS